MPRLLAPLRAQGTSHQECGNKEVRLCVCRVLLRTGERGRELGTFPTAPIGHQHLPGCSCSALLCVLSVCVSLTNLQPKGCTGWMSQSLCNPEHFYENVSRIKALLHVIKVARMPLLSKNWRWVSLPPKPAYFLSFLPIFIFFPQFLPWTKCLFFE